MTYYRFTFPWLYISLSVYTGIDLTPKNARAPLLSPTDWTLGVVPAGKGNVGLPRTQCLRSAADAIRLHV